MTRFLDISQPSICPPCRVEAGQQHARLGNTPLEENPTHTYGGHADENDLLD